MFYIDFIKGDIQGVSVVYAKDAHQAKLIFARDHKGCVIIGCQMQ